MESLALLAKDRIGHKNPFPPLEGFAENGDACHWGFSDLYPESEKVLRDAIANKKTFDTRWVGCKKEICSFRIISNGKIVTLQTFAEMDDIDDLIYDACDDGVELTEEQIEEIKEYWYEDVETYTETSNERTIELTTYEDIIKNLVEMGDEDNKYLTDCFERVKSWIKMIIETAKLEDEA